LRISASILPTVCTRKEACSLPSLHAEKKKALLWKGTVAFLSEGNLHPSKTLSTEFWVGFPQA
jgi:hypothetical protein